MKQSDLAKAVAEARAHRWRGSLHEFVRGFWSVAEPGAPFVDSWSLGAICEFTQAWCERQFKRGVLNVPPGCSKSLILEVFAPAWVWAQAPDPAALMGPHHRWLGCSYDAELVLRDASKMKQLVESELYLQAFPATQLKPDSKALHRLFTTSGGLRFSTSVAGRGIGWHFHSAVIDDPTKPQNVLDGSGEVELKKALTWHDKVLPTRRADPPRFGTMLVMQRILEADLAGECLKREGYEHLCLPMHYQPKATWIRGDWSAKLDKRTEPGELLNPERFPEAVVKELEVSLGAEASAQLEQNPVPRTGGLLQEAWLRWEWIEIPYKGLWIQVWDLSGKGTDILKHSAVHGALWVAQRCTSVRELLDSIDDRERAGRCESRPVQVASAERYHLIDECWGVWPYEETLKQIVAAQQRPLWNRAHLKLFEEKASGVQAVQQLSAGWQAPDGQRHRLVGIRPTAPSTDKISEFRPVVPPAAEAGLILLPPWRRNESRPGGATGPDAWRAELLGFPHAKRNDRVDTTSNALKHFSQGHSSWLANVRKAAANP